MIGTPRTEGRALPPGFRYIPHQGRRERLRRLHQTLRRIEKRRDPETVAALARIRESVKDEPEPEAGVLNLVHTALMAAEDCGTTWAESATVMMDRFDRMEL